MNLNEYQSAARETAVYPTDFDIPRELQGVYYTVLGLCGEAGETANKVKKVFRGDFTIEQMRSAILHELGGVLWYLANAAHELGSSLEIIAYLNLEELKERKRKGTIKGSGDER